MLKCEMCPAHVRIGKWWEPIYGLFWEIRNPKPILIYELDEDNKQAHVMIVCTECRKWIEDNPVAAEGIIRSIL